MANQVPITHQSREQLLHHLRVLSAEAQRLSAGAEQMRKIVWLIVHEQNGRVEIPEAGWIMALKMPPDDFAFRINHDVAGKVVELLECDQQGDDVSKIIRPPGFNGA